MKKVFAILVALMLVLSMSTVAMAEQTYTITITNPVAGNTYKVYKVFDAVGNGATAISYKLVAGQTTAPTGFTVDDAGNVTYTGQGKDGKLTSEDIAALATYVNEMDAVDTKVADESQTEITLDVKSDGYYYITTTTGTAVTVDSANHSVTVQDKNEAPQIEKTATSADSLDTNGKQALAQVGTSVEYKVEIDVKTGAKGYVLHDKMGAGLSYNNDVKVTVDDEEITAGDTTFSTTIANGDSVTVTFVDSWIAAQVGKKVVVTYSAKITSDALTMVTGKNTASLNYGESSKTVNSEVNVYNAKITVTKVDGQENALAGAGFVLAKTVTEDGESKTVYYKKDNTTGVSWVDNIEEATELMTTAENGGNVVAFTGLANGTYTLIETTVPTGYNKAVDQEITIIANDYTETNLAKTAKVVNNAGTELPSTGGIGTTIFYVVGGLLMAAAVVLLVTKKKVNASK